MDSQEAFEKLRDALSHLMTDDNSCETCRHSYHGADLILRCRVSTNGLKCSPEAYSDCKKYVREPGTEYKCDEQGRGD